MDDDELVLPDMATDVMCMCHLGTRTSSDPSGGERSYGGLLAGGGPGGGGTRGVAPEAAASVPFQNVGSTEQVFGISGALRAPFVFLCVLDRLCSRPPSLACAH